MTITQVTTLPDDLPVPEDDGAADHLVGLALPDISLPATNGATVALAGLGGTTVLYIYPMTGRPDRALPDGWNDIPGARGCTPQSCSFRDHFAELQALGVTHLYGISTQSTDYQAEARDRLHLPFELLSDADGALRTTLGLPSMLVDNDLLLKRMALICVDGEISKVFYPVFPPDRNAADVLAWLEANR